MTIHASDPFATPDDARSPVRRLRGRLAAAVTLWTAYDADGQRVGLTVSSTMVVDGEPARLLGTIDDESMLWRGLRDTGRFVVAPLRAGDRLLADAFAGLMPAPGGAFVGREWLDTEYGPVLDGVAAWAACRLDDVRPMGWGLLVESTVDRVEISAETAEGPLVHYRGRYLRSVLPSL